MARGTVMAALELQPAPASADAPARTARNAWITLAALLCAYVLAFVDRQAPSLLTEPLKRALRLDDAQASLLLGPAFGVVLALAGLPLARRIDSGRRIRLIALATGFWSLMTLGCGLAAGYGMLLLFRMGVGLGEAALTPAAHAVIAESFPARRVGFALGLYGAGAYLGMGLAYWGGGHLLALVASSGGAGAFAPWRVAFLTFGAPGLLVAGWIATRPEPPRGLGRGAWDGSLRSTLRFFWRRRGAVATVNLTLAFVAMTAYATTAWAPSLLVRAYGLTTSQAGVALGPLVAATGLGGALLGGLAADLAERRWPDGRLRVMTIAALATAPFAAAAPLASTAGTCLACLGGVFFLTTVAVSVGPSA